MFFLSAGATTASPSRRRVRLVALCSSRWFLPARWRMSLPVPVILNRLLAPLCVFVFGMVAVVSLVLWSPQLRGHAPSPYVVARRDQARSTCVIAGPAGGPPATCPLLGSLLRLGLPLVSLHQLCL